MCLAFVADGASTLLCLRAGGRELNPLVAELGPGLYVWACVLRSAIACALLEVTADASPAVRGVTRGGCLVLILGKAAATASNVAGLG